MGGGTMGVADLYGTPSTVGGIFSPLSIQNPNGADVAPMATATASGGGDASGPGPALALIGLVITLVMLRVALHAAGEA